MYFNLRTQPNIDKENRIQEKTYFLNFENRYFYQKLRLFQIVGLLEDVLGDGDDLLPIVHHVEDGELDVDLLVLDGRGEVGEVLDLGLVLGVEAHDLG